MAIEVKNSDNNVMSPCASMFPKSLEIFNGNVSIKVFNILVCLLLDSYTDTYWFCRDHPCFCLIVLTYVWPLAIQLANLLRSFSTSYAGFSYKVVHMYDVRNIPSARKIRVRPARKFRGTRAENPHRSMRNKHGIPRKKFSVSCTVCNTLL